MVNQIKYFDELVKELSNINVSIEVGPLESFDGDSIPFGKEITPDDPIISEFSLRFQNEVSVTFNAINESSNAYSLKLKDLRFNFQKEISDEILRTRNKLPLLNLLVDYRIRFSELFDGYYYRKFHIHQVTFKVLVNPNIQIHKNLDKPINDKSVAMILDKYNRVQFENIKYILKYLKAKTSILKDVVQQRDNESIDINESKKRNPREYPTKSFKLNPKLFESDQLVTDKLKDFHEALKSNDFINPIDFRFFIQSFTDRSVTKKIRWIGSADELYFLMKTLYEKDIIVKFKNYWKVACDCFIAYHKSNKLCTHQSLQRCKPPTRSEQLRKLKSVISTLK